MNERFFGSDALWIGLARANNPKSASTDNDIDPKNRARDINAKTQYPPKQPEPWREATRGPRRFDNRGLP